MRNLKTSVICILTALVAEAFLMYLIYFNPNKIQPLMPQNIQMWINCLCNFASAVSLSLAYFHIKKKNIRLHKIFIFIALGFSSIFLINYIIYHMSIGHMVFAQNNWRGIYLIILATHLIASVISLPMIFLTTVFGLQNNLKEHKRLGFITFIFWQYVSITGVIIVLFLKFLQ